MSDLPQIPWLRVETADELDKVLGPALAQIEFNTCSAVGNRDKFGRPLTMVGYKASYDTKRINVLGIISADRTLLQQRVVDYIQKVYGDRHPNQLIHIWQPKPRDTQRNPYKD